MPRVKSLPGRLAHRGNKLERRPHPVLQRAAVLVAAKVGQGRQELPGQTGMAELELDAVEAAFTGMDGALGKIAGHLLDILRLHLLRRLTEEDVGHGRRCPDRQPGDAAVPLLAVVVQLGEYLGVELVDVIGDLLETGDHLGMVHVDQLFVRHVGRMDAHLLGDDQARLPPWPVPPSNTSAARWGGCPPQGWSGAAGKKCGFSLRPSPA